MSQESVPQPREATTDSLIGQTLAHRYLIEMRLGEGAMGAVYRARHVKVGRPFAVKVLHPRLLEDPKVAQRFEREAELAGRLHHPNVIGVVDVGETAEGLRYMVMDFAEGPDLATLLAEAPLRPQRITHLIRQILEGLYHAHEEGLIHRDFKPENVIVERDTHGDEVPRIVDFGIAILRDGGDSASAQGRLTTNGLVLGTPHYMAPEQAVADPIDHRIDLFALGIVIYEMLCGRLPFDGTGAEVARANLLLDPPPIDKRVPHLEVDPLLEAYSRRLMAKKRDHRPPTAKAARELLDLITSDRAAAGVALGVSIAAGTRGPAVTETVPAGAAHDAPRATDLEAPLIAGRLLARPSHQLQTSLGDPVGATDQLRPAHRGRWIAAIAGGGVAIVALALAFALHGSHDDHPTVKPDPTEIPTPIVKADPPPVAPVVVAPPAPPVSPPVAAPTAVRPASHPVTHKAAIEHHPAAVEHHADPPVISDAPAHEATVERPATHEAVPPPAAPTAATAANVAAAYQAVGRQLKALEDSRGAEATAELWPRFRMIQFSDAISTPEKREAAFQALAKIARDARAK